MTVTTTAEALLVLWTRLIITWDAIIIFVTLRLVTLKFAAQSIRSTFAATPPHFPGVLGVMRAARPVEIVVVFIIFATIFTNLRSLRKVSLFLLKQSNSCFELMLFFN